MEPYRPADCCLRVSYGETEMNKIRRDQAALAKVEPDKCYYIYIHKRLSDNKVFYVGKGKGYRAWQVQGRNDRWSKTSKKHGLLVELLYTGLTESAAFNLETLVINSVKVEFAETLCNMTEGGEGLSGFKWSEEQMVNHPAHKLKGVPLTEEHRKSISEGMIGRIVSDETRSKLKSSNKLAYLPVRVFNHMKRVLVGKPVVPYNYLEKITGIDPKTFYRKPSFYTGFTREAILKSAETRKGKPSWNKGKKCPENSGENSASADLKVYKFIRLEDGKTFVGTRYQLCRGFNLDLANIGRLFYTKASPKSQGWSLLKEEDGTR